MSFFPRRAFWLAAPLLLSACTYLTATQAQSGQATSSQAPSTEAQSAAPPAGGNPLALNFAAPNAARGGPLSASCAGCHGAGGVSTNPKIPSLAGQITPYLHLQLAAFRAKLRPSPVMQGVAAHLSDQDIADLAAYYTAQPVGAAWKAEAEARARGEKLFMSGDAGRGVIACQVCHGENGRGVSDNHVASVTNLSPDYAVEVMHEFRDTPSFGGLVAPEAMRIALKPLSDTDLKDVAAYISSMKP